MVSTEDRAYSVMQELDVTHVVVRFGGFIGYKSDDLSKLPWMLKIAKTAAGGGAKIRPSDYYTKAKEFRIDALGTPSLLNSFLYVEAKVHSHRGWPRRIWMLEDTDGVVCCSPNRQVAAFCLRWRVPDLTLLMTSSGTS